MRFRYFDRQLQGTTGADTLDGNEDDELILGNGGNDRLVGNDGRDTLSSSEGADTLLGRNGDDVLLGGAGADLLDGGADSDRLHGDAGADTLLGGLGDDLILGGADNDSVDGGRNDDTLAGNAGADTLKGNTGDDALWGGAGNDRLEGGDGNDSLAGGFGADRLDGGRDNDVLLSRSDAGEPEIAGDPGAPRMTEDAFKASDTLTGGAGADLFRWELVVNAPSDVVEAHADSRGWIDWGGITGENDGWHDHWVDGIGEDVITDFSWAAGDRIEIAGHTVHARVLVVDADGDGAADDTRIELYSDQGASGGAHHMDELGRISVLNAVLTEAQVVVNHHETYGAYDRIGEGPHRFEDQGLWVDGGTDWVFGHREPGVLRQGGAGSESMSGGTDDDTVFGGGGSDTLNGMDGDDIVDGGDGTDRLYGSNGDDLLIGGANSDWMDGGADRDKLIGGTGRDSVLGGMGDDHLFGGAESDLLDGGRNDDSLAGNEAEDTLRGNTGDDDLWGASGNDLLEGGDGNDFLAGGFGADRLTGGRGNDTLLSRSDAGEPEVAQPGGYERATADSFAAGDTLTGGTGADLFRWELVINAPDEVAEAHASETGWVSWGSVAGENDGVHDHWVDGIGADVITDFSWTAGDRIEIAGHTVHAHVHIKDCDGDGAVDDTCIELYSDQGANGGAHHMDELGHISVLNAILTEAQVVVNHHETYGAYDRIGQGPHRFEDAGLWTDGNRDWGLLLPA